MSQQFSHCRVYGHRWDSIEVEFGTGVIYETLVCVHCSTKRTDRIKRRTGLISGRTYKYPAWYLRQGEGQFGTEERGKMRLVGFDQKSYRIANK